jgi:hypothetical protein
MPRLHVIAASLATLMVREIDEPAGLHVCIFCRTDLKVFFSSSVACLMFRSSSLV